MPHCEKGKPCDVDDCFYCPNEPRRPIAVIVKCPSCGGPMDVFVKQTTGGFKEVRKCRDKKYTGCGI